MSILNTAERLVVSFANKAQDTIGDVIFDYTGIMTGDFVNTAIFYILLVFWVVLLWQLLKPGESVYHYDLKR